MATATPKQIDYLRALLAKVIETTKDVKPWTERCVLEDFEAHYTARIPEHTVETASETIDALKAQLAILEARRAVATARENNPYSDW